MLEGNVNMAHRPFHCYGEREQVTRLEVRTKEAPIGSRPIRLRSEEVPGRCAVDGVREYVHDDATGVCQAVRRRMCVCYDEALPTLEREGRNAKCYLKATVAWTALENSCTASNRKYRRLCNIVGDIAMCIQCCVVKSVIQVIVAAGTL